MILKYFKRILYGIDLHGLLSKTPSRLYRSVAMGARNAVYRRSMEMMMAEGSLDEKAASRALLDVLDRRRKRGRPG